MGEEATPKADAAHSEGFFPAHIFDAPMLRGLDARARRELSEAGRLLSFRKGEAVFRPGERAEAFFVVAEGAVELLALRRGDDKESEIRTAKSGDAFGEEAVIGAERRTQAVAREKSKVAEIPVHIFRRVAERSGKAEFAEKMERILRRNATRDLLSTLALTRDLSGEQLDVLLDAVNYKKLERGQAVYREGDPATEVWLLADGMVQIQTEEGDRLHVRAYLSRGDFFGDSEVLDRCPRRTSAVASGGSLLLSIPARAFRKLVEQRPEISQKLARISERQSEAQQALIGAAAANHTQHVFRDLYRMDVARSLLVIDVESCVRCGHCAWACEDLYGTARLVRRGDKMIAQVERQKEAPSHLLVPNSCQHCNNPSCMMGCPTGAIGRDPRGEVFVRPELCTGCGACAKACPWDNIQMAERPPGVPKPAGGEPGDYAQLAVKCDLCRDYEEGPACVQACPTASIFRINPAEEIADLRELLGGGRKKARAKSTSLIGISFVLSGLIAGFSIAAVGAVMRGRGLWRPALGLGYASGIAAAVGFGLLLVYAVPKRFMALGMHKRKTEKDNTDELGSNAVVSRTRPHFLFHLAIGFLAAGFAYSHASISTRPTTGSTLSIAFYSTVILGALSALFYALVPPMLSRIERAAVLPEDYRRVKKELLERLYREVSGRNELMKKIFEKMLLPYINQPLGPLFLLMKRVSLREEERAMRGRVEQVLEGRGSDKLAGLNELIRIAVELRSLPAQRLLSRLLRYGLPLHILTFVIAAVLLILHIVFATRYRQ